MAGNVIVKLLNFKPPTASSAAGSNAAHLNYIGCRPGTDRSVTNESINYGSSSIAYNNLSSDDKYLTYIATRPGVDKKGVHGEHLSVDHGLFGQYGVPDKDAVTTEIRGLKNSPMYRFVISLDETTASELGFDRKEKWESMLRSQAVYLADKMSIPAQDMGWVAALHLKDGHPHVHLVVWDRLDRTRRNRGLNFIPKESLNEIRAGFTKAIYAEKRLELYAIKNAGRDIIIDMAKNDTELVRGFLRQAAAKSNTVTMPSPSSISIKSLSQSIKELSDIMPDRGRVSYAFMPEPVKARVDAVVKEVLSNHIYAAKLGDVTAAVRSLTEQFTLNLDKIDSATNKAAADIAKRLAQQILKTASQMKQDTAKIAIHMNLPSLISLKTPVRFHEQEALRFLRCLASAGVDRNAAILVCKSVIEPGSIASCCKTAGLSDNTAAALVDHAFSTANGKLRADDWKRVSRFIEEAELRALAYEERAEKQALLNSSMSLMRTVFRLLQSPRSQQNFQTLFEKGRTRKRRDALYTKDELE